MEENGSGSRGLNVDFGMEDTSMFLFAKHETSIRTTGAIVTLGSVTGTTTSGCLPLLCDFGVVAPFLYLL